MYEDNNGNNTVNGPSYGTYNSSYNNQFGLSDNSNALSASSASDGLAPAASVVADTATAAPAATSVDVESQVSTGSASGNPSSPFAYTYDSQSGVSGSTYGSQSAAAGNTYSSQNSAAGSTYSAQSTSTGNVYSSQNAAAGSTYGAQSSAVGNAYSSQNTAAGNSYSSPAAASGSSYSSYSSQGAASGSSYGAQNAVSGSAYGSQGTASGSTYGSQSSAAGSTYGSQSTSTGPVYSYSTQNSPYSSNSYSSGNSYGGNYSYDSQRSNSSSGAYTSSGAASQYTQQNGGSNGQTQPKKKKSPVGIILLASALVVLCLLIVGGVAIARFIGSNSHFSAQIGNNTFDSDDPIFDDKDAEAVPEDSDISDEDDKDDDTDDDTDSEDKTAVASGSDEDDYSSIDSGYTTKTVVSDVSSMVEDVMPSMVAITNHMTLDYYYYQEQGDASGSGIIIGKNDNELLIATNYHVVASNDGIDVSFIDDTKIAANVKGADEQMDLAVVAVNLSDIPDDTMDRIEIATMGDSDNLKIGEPAIAIGNSLGYGLSVTTGVISALNREVYEEGEQGAGSAVKGFIQTDAAINPGNSGGALLNINGEVIGINSNKIGGSNVEGMGYAIPISAAEPILGNLMSKVTKVSVPEDERGYLGISGATVTPSEIEYYGLPEGVYIATVNGGSPAAEVGLQKGDFVVAVNDEKVDSMGDLQKELSYYRAGDEIEISVKRLDGDDYTDLKYKVKLGDKGVLEG